MMRTSPTQRMKSRVGHQNPRDKTTLRGRVTRSRNGMMSRTNASYVTSAWGQA